MLKRPAHSIVFRRLCILGLVIIIGLAACSNSSKTLTNGVSEVNKDLTTLSESEFTFGIIYPLAHSYYERITDQAKQEAAAVGGTLIVRAPDEANVEQQIRMLESMIRLKPDGIAISPIDSIALTPYINQAVDAGIPVVCFESDAPSSKRLAFIGGDNKRAGALIGESLSKLLSTGGMVLVESGVSNTQSHQERLNGFIDYIREHTEIQILEVRHHEGSSERALSDLERMIDDHPHFDAFVGLDFISGFSSILAYKAMGLTRYALTFGMMPSIEEAINNGQITLAVSQNESTWGSKIISTLLSAKNGESVNEFMDTGESIIVLEQ
ncbi:substrate-binding domain-containing protein [Paenibacillus sp. LHD-117]|uniref:sugar ABC transporter substrate-binding protein n=1 Tax=Paenibacillus sp. LHD-117 TaxID=3071412 RepID=UPI0027DFE105|nr:substrate-binding domain-containing protein [Paenibacillus sp. LHD-117]MDQ6417837.1 substrate-binding domain-containing protein [Paenibacillus sp. LHD-117]